MIKGMGVSKGIAIAKTFVYEKATITFEEKSTLEPAKEIQRFNDSVMKFVKSTEILVEKIKLEVGEAEAEILESHSLIANDPEITSNIKNLIKDNRVTAEFAVEHNFNQFSDLFISLGDELLAQRASDLQDVKTRLLELLTGIESDSLKNINYPCILVTKDLTPSDVANMNKKMVEGIITEVGGYSSHTAIIARALELPAVLGVNNLLSQIENNILVIINGETGEINNNPSEEDLTIANEQIKELEKLKLLLEDYKGKESISKDGHIVELFANIGSAIEIESVLKNDAGGIGLFRTEFLYMDSKSLPTEDEQFKAYKEVAESLNGKEVIIRTLDVGGDKDIPYLNLDKEENPFLGYRAIRLCLNETEIFKTQIRAILRASHFGNIKIMIPMITTLTELRQSKAIIEECKRQLLEKEINFNNEINIGIMIETPAASLISDFLAKECDFFSIGTNDLTQYTMAVDRGNIKVAYLYSSFDPAVLRSIHTVISNAKKVGIKACMCGEAASDELMVPFLLGCGLDEFSMTPSSVLPTRKLLTNLSYEEMKSKIPEILKLETAKEAKNYLAKLILDCNSLSKS